MDSRKLKLIAKIEALEETKPLNGIQRRMESLQKEIDTTKQRADERINNSKRMSSFERFFRSDDVLADLRKGNDEYIQIIKMQHQLLRDQEIIKLRRLIQEAKNCLQDQSLELNQIEPNESDSDSSHSREKKRRCSN